MAIGDVSLACQTDVDFWSETVLCCVRVYYTFTNPLSAAMIRVWRGRWNQVEEGACCRAVEEEWSVRVGMEAARLAIVGVGRRRRLFGREINCWLAITTDRQSASRRSPARPIDYQPTNEPSHRRADQLTDELQPADHGTAPVVDRSAVSVCRPMWTRHQLTIVTTRA